MPTYLGRFPVGSSPVAVFSGAPVASYANMDGAPPHMAARMRNGLGAVNDPFGLGELSPPDFSASPSTGTSSNSAPAGSSGGGFSWQSIGQDVSNAASLLSKLFGQQTQPTGLTPAQQQAYLAALAAQRNQTPAWVWPTVIGVGVLAAGGVIVYALKR